MGFSGGFAQGKLETALPATHLFHNSPVPAGQSKPEKAPKLDGAASNISVLEFKTMNHPEMGMSKIKGFTVFFTILTKTAWDGLLTETLESELMALTGGTFNRTPLVKVPNPESPAQKVEQKTAKQSPEPLFYSPFKPSFPEEHDNDIFIASICGGRVF